jgi:hypothetical protein
MAAEERICAFEKGITDALSIAGASYTDFPDSFSDVPGVCIYRLPHA